MHNKRILLALSCLIVCILSLSACSNQQSDKSEPLKGSNLSIDFRFQKLYDAGKEKPKSLKRILHLADTETLGKLLLHEIVPTEDMEQAIAVAYDNYVMHDSSFKKLRRHSDPVVKWRTRILWGLGIFILLTFIIVLLVDLLDDGSPRCPKCGSKDLYDTQMSDNAADWLSTIGAGLWGLGKELGKQAVAKRFGYNYQPDHATMVYGAKNNQAQMKQNLTRVKRHCNNCGHSWHVDVNNY